MALISTPENRFVGVPEYDYPVEYVSAGEPEMAYVDIPGDGDETFLCLHGEPTWGSSTGNWSTGSPTADASSFWMPPDSGCQTSTPTTRPTTSACTMTHW